jgi:hypothetical protein
LCNYIFENDQTLKSGKEELKKGYYEIWLKETDKKSYDSFVTIRDSAENIDLALLEFLYTFNKKLSYRFAGTLLIKSPIELSDIINKNSEYWEAGKQELFNSSILVWLKNYGNIAIVNKWDRVKKNYEENQDVGLEEFLHLLNEKLVYGQLKASHDKIEFPRIQSGKIVSADIVFSNEKRGYLSVDLAFSKALPGVSIKPQKLQLNSAAKNNVSSLNFKIDSKYLLKGVEYETKIQVLTSANQQSEIPVSFKIVFPKNSFILEILKYSFLVALFFGLIRLIISSNHPGWLNASFNFFTDWNYAILNRNGFSDFGWAFFAFVGLASLGIIFLIRYLRKNRIK